MQRIRIPFSHLSKNEVHNLAIAAILTFYIILVGQDIFLNNFCGDLGFDFCAYWSGGKIINSSGYADIYNGKLLRGIEEEIYPQAETLDVTFEEVPLPYLPFFMIPFQILSLIGLPYSFILWTILNVGGFYFYMRFFIREMTGSDLPQKLMLLVLLSLPVFLNLNYGQVNIWLGICAGEFVRALNSNKALKAGFWLGGWLFKPQLLLFIIPVLLFRRKFRALLGFFLSSLLVVAISYLLIGREGFLSLFELIRNSSQGGATSNAQIMMNWRMLGLHFASFFGHEVGWAVIIIGSSITTIFSFLMVLKQKWNNSVSLVKGLLGLFAATCAVTWHAHFSMSIVIIPLMIYLVIINEFSTRLFNFWLYLPLIGSIWIYIIAALVQIDLLPIFFNEIVDLIQGITGLIVNLLILKWARKTTATITCNDSMAKV